MKRIVDFFRKFFNYNVYDLNGSCEIYYNKNYKKWIFFCFVNTFCQILPNGHHEQARNVLYDATYYIKKPNEEKLLKAGFKKDKKNYYSLCLNRKISTEKEFNEIERQIEDLQKLVKENNECIIYRI